MKITNKVLFAEAIEEIDGGCGPCIKTFIGKLKECISEEDYQLLMAEFKKSEPYWLDELKEDE